MDNDKTRFMFHVETKGYEDTFEHRSYPDIILTEYATFNGNERWPDVVRAFTRFLGNVYGYNIEEKFNEMYIDPLTKYEEQQREDTQLDLFKDQ
jgi:hypothetical protein